MSNMIRIVCGLVLLVLLSSTATVTADVVWEHSMDDDTGDVEDDEGGTVDMPGLDMLEVTMSDEGDDINITMTLDGEYNGTASYSVNLDVDGDQAWSVSKVILVGFMATDPSGNMIDVEGYISEDGTKISWVLAKADVPATDSVKLAFAMTNLVDLSALPDMVSYSDTASPGQQPSEEEATVKSVSITIDFEELTVMEMKMVMVYTGNGTADMRTSLDNNADGTVSAAEVSTYEDQMNDLMGDADTNITLDGKEANSTVGAFSIDGAEGPADSKDDLTWTLTSTSTFPEPEDAKTHTYAWPAGDDEFIGGDEPWENEVDVAFEIRCPDGWRFDTDGWSAELKDLLRSDDTVIHMDGDQLRTSYNSTVGDLSSLVIEEKGGDGGDDSPGFGLVLVLSAVGLVVLAARRRR